MGYSFAETGQNVQIYEPTSILFQKNIYLKNYIMIAEYCWIMAGNKTIIGNFNHIASHCSFTGGNLTLLEDFVSLSSGVRLIPGTDLSDGRGLINSTIPAKYRSVLRSFVHLSRFSFLASNVVCLPGVTVGEGAVVGANSIISADIEPWTINLGSPARAIRRRKKGIMLDLADKIYTDLSIEPFTPCANILKLKTEEIMLPTVS